MINKKQKKEFINNYNKLSFDIKKRLVIEMMIEVLMLKMF